MNPDQRAALKELGTVCAREGLACERILSLAVPGSRYVAIVRNPAGERMFLKQTVPSARGRSWQ